MQRKASSRRKRFIAAARIHLLRRRHREGPEKTNPCKAALNHLIIKELTRICSMQATDNLKTVSLQTLLTRLKKIDNQMLLLMRKKSVLKFQPRSVGSSVR